MKEIEYQLKISQLIAKDQFGMLSEQERQMLADWLQADEANRLLYTEIKKDLTTDVVKHTRIDSAEEWKKFVAVNGLVTRPVWYKQSWFKVAALLALVGSVGFIYLKQQRDIKERLNGIASKTSLSVSPADSMFKEHKGIVLLSNGESKNLDAINPDSTLNLQAVLLDNTNKKSVDAADEVQMNTLIIPRGAEFKVKLPDGTIAWLNAGSSLTFPSKFIGATRKITIEGEVCLDVFHNPAQPFVVQAGEQSIQVLGTLFNVENYKGQNARTTLVRGKIEVAYRNKKTILKPNEQFIIQKDGHTQLVKVNAVESIQWTNGTFEFTDTSLEEIMLKLGRWYDVSYQFVDAGAREARFTLQVERNESLAQLLKKIEMTGRVQFNKKGKTIKIFE